MLAVGSTVGSGIQKGRNSSPWASGDRYLFFLSKLVCTCCNDVRRSRVQISNTWPRDEGRPPFSTGCLWQMTWAGVCGLHKALRLALFPAVSRLRWFRLFVFSFAFSVGFGRLAVAAVSFLCLVVRVRHTATALLN